MGLFFVFVEVLIAPEVLLKTRQSTTVVADVATPNIEIPSVEIVLPTADSQQTADAQEFFPQLAALQTAGIKLSDGRQETALFSQIALDPNVEPFILHSWQITRNDVPIGTVVNIASKTDVGVTTAFLQLRRYIEDVLEQHGSAGIVTDVYHTRGEDNFYLNNPTDFPNTVFMIVRSGDKILAFTYGIAYHEPHCEPSPQASPDNMSCRGGELKALIPLFF